MAASSNRKEADIFRKAVVILDAHERANYLRQACYGDEELKRRIELLVAADADETGFLKLDDTDMGEINGSTEGRLPDESFGTYRSLRYVESGGTSDVYLGEQTQPYHQLAAIKILRPNHLQTKVAIRFQRECEFLGAMNHPSIPKLFNTGVSESGLPYMVMEWVDGIPITQYCRERELSIRDRVALFIKICQGIQYAHFKGVIHRDLKPGNILVSEYGAVAEPKIIDFGIAKSADRKLDLRGDKTQSHEVVGTLSYMSPEHLNHHAEVDTRSDVFSLGVLLYEILTEEHPFSQEIKAAENLQEAVEVIAEHVPTCPSKRVATIAKGPPGISSNPAVFREIRRDLDRVVLKMIGKSPDDRYGTISQVAEDLQCYLDCRPLVHSSTPFRVSVLRYCQRNSVLMKVSCGLLLLAFALLGISVWAGQARVKEHRLSERLSLMNEQLSDAQQEQEVLDHLRASLLPRVIALAEKGDFLEAFLQIKGLSDKAVLQQDFVFRKMWQELSATVSFPQLPNGTTLHVARSEGKRTTWVRLGKTPSLFDVPKGYARIRLEHPDYIAREIGLDLSEDFEIIQKGLLEPREQNKPGMLFIPAASESMTEVFSGDLISHGFWVDQCEVTNEAFLEFIADGGYENGAYWQHLEIVRDGETINWREAVSMFKDRTGEPGPANWANGKFPDGEANFPVDGVSWYEAAAYATYRGKVLPSVQHWRFFSVSSDPQTVSRFCNFSGRISAVGAFSGTGYHGVKDVYGNVSEWCSNSNESGLRVLSGAAANDPDYLFWCPKVVSPWERKSGNGFRCIEVEDLGEYEALSRLPIENRRPVDLDRHRQPLSDLSRWYRYKTDQPLHPVIIQSEDVEGSRRDYHHETIELNTVYDESRFNIHIFTPRHRSSNITLIYLPGIGRYNKPMDFSLANRSDIDIKFIDELTGKGHRVVYPIYQGCYERWVKSPSEHFQVDAASAQASWIQCIQDAMCTLDYLETRDDVNPDRIIGLGFSIGADKLITTLAIDSRFDRAILLSVGYHNWQKDRPIIDAFQYTPHIDLPVLLVTGIHDNLYTYENSQIPLFKDLASQEKRHVLMEGGHVPEIGEVVTHVDRWLRVAP